MAKEQASGDMVVAVGKDRCGDGDGIAQRAPGGIAAAVHLWLNIFNDDALATFNRFHSAQFQKFVFRFDKLLTICILPFTGQPPVREMRLGLCSVAGEEVRTSGKANEKAKE
jgi:hypothetical protein